jgi:hypothetical protein
MSGWWIFTKGGFGKEDAIKNVGFAHAERERANGGTAPYPLCAASFISAANSGPKYRSIAPCTA